MLPCSYAPIARINSSETYRILEKLFIYFDYAPAHTSMIVREFLAESKATIMPHPPYSSDMGPADFFLFPKLKTPVKGKHFVQLVLL